MPQLATSPHETFSKRLLTAINFLAVCILQVGCSQMSDSKAQVRDTEKTKERVREVSSTILDIIGLKER